MDAADMDRLADDFRRQQAHILRAADGLTRKAGLDAVAQGQADAPVDTGHHRSTIGMDVLGIGRVQVGAASNYAPHLEYGTWKMDARPHINPAVDAQVPAWQAAVLQAAGEFL